MQVELLELNFDINFIH